MAYSFYDMTGRDYYWITMKQRDKATENMDSIHIAIE